MGGGWEEEGRRRWGWGEEEERTNGEDIIFHDSCTHYHDKRFVTAQHSPKGTNLKSASVCLAGYHSLYRKERVKFPAPSKRGLVTTRGHWQSVPEWCSQHMKSWYEMSFARLSCAVLMIACMLLVTMGVDTWQQEQYPRHQRRTVVQNSVPPLNRYITRHKDSSPHFQTSFHRKKSSSALEVVVRDEQEDHSTTGEKVPELLPSSSSAEQGSARVDRSSSLETRDAFSPWRPAPPAGGRTKSPGLLPAPPSHRLSEHHVEHRTAFPHDGAGAEGPLLHRGDLLQEEPTSSVLSAVGEENYGGADYTQRQQLVLSPVRPALMDPPHRAAGESLASSTGVQHHVEHPSTTTAFSTTGDHAGGVHGLLHRGRLQDSSTSSAVSAVGTAKDLSSVGAQQFGQADTQLVSPALGPRRADEPSVADNVVSSNGEQHAEHLSNLSGRGGGGFGRADTQPPPALGPPRRADESVSNRVLSTVPSSNHDVQHRVELFSSALSSDGDARSGARPAALHRGELQESAVNVSAVEGKSGSGFWGRRRRARRRRAAVRRRRAARPSKQCPNPRFPYLTTNRRWIADKICFKNPAKIQSGDAIQNWCCQGKHSPSCKHPKAQMCAKPSKQCPNPRFPYLTTNRRWIADKICFKNPAKIQSGDAIQNWCCQGKHSPSCKHPKAQQCARKSPSGYDKHQGWSRNGGKLYSRQTTGITEAACRHKVAKCGGYYYDSVTSGGWCKTISKANVDAVRKDLGKAWVRGHSYQNTFLPNRKECKKKQKKGRYFFARPKQHCPKGQNIHDKKDCYAAYKFLYATQRSNFPAPSKRGIVTTKGHWRGVPEWCSQHVKSSYVTSHKDSSPHFQTSFKSSSAIEVEQSKASVGDDVVQSNPAASVVHML